MYLNIVFIKRIINNHKLLCDRFHFSILVKLVFIKIREKHVLLIWCLVRSKNIGRWCCIRKKSLQFNPNKAVFFEGSFFQEELIWYQCNFMQLLNNLFKVCWRWKNADIICYKLTSLVSLQQGNVKKSEKLMKIDENS